jgi:Protein of unknown function (DUF3179)
MRARLIAVLIAGITAAFAAAQQPPLLVKPDAFKTLVNPNCSHCRDEAKRRAADLRPDDRVLCWTRGYSDGGAIPYRFFLNAYRVISDSYGVFVHDPDAGFARGFGPWYHFRFHGWRNGVMVMKDEKDGTLYSCLTGLAFDGPKKGTRLTPVPTLVSDWGVWLERYPQAVAYHMFDKYQPVDLPAAVNEDSHKSRGKADPRLPAETMVLGVWDGHEARAYSLDVLAKAGFIAEQVEGKKRVILWDPKTRTASAYLPVASPAGKYTAPRPNADGVSPQEKQPDAPLRPLTLTLDRQNASAPFVDKETKSRWDVAGRAVEGELKGWTLTWLDSTQVKWFAWAAEYPMTTVYEDKKPSAGKQKVGDAIREIAGTAEFLRNVPKKFATVKSIDAGKHAVTLQIDGDKEPTSWTIAPDAEFKISGWWGRLEQFAPDQRVWAWFSVDRAKKPRAIFMLSDEASEQEIHGLAKPDPKKPMALDLEKMELLRIKQKQWLRQHWLNEGLPGTIGFLHLYSGETDVILDHETMRWARSLVPGDKVELAAQPPIKAVVKTVTPQREKTQVRVVIHSIDLAELQTGHRVHLQMKAPPPEVEAAQMPPDIDRPKSKAERIEWFLANIYCTCGVGGDICTGHFYTLASCNPNGCGSPNATRHQIGELIDQGRTNRQIFEELLQDRGPAMLRPHLLR